MDDVDAAMRVMDACRMDADGQEEAEGVGHEVTLASLDLFACVVADGPPFSVVLTD